MFLEPWQIIALAFVAALIGGAVTRAGLRRQFAALHQQFIIAGDHRTRLGEAIEGKASRADVENEGQRIIDRLDPDKRAELRERRLQATIPGYGAPIPSEVTRRHD